MPNLVLKSNIANRTFSVQPKVLKMPVKPGVVELVITPISTHTIDAKDFTVGFLPQRIASIKYENLGGKVIAKVLIAAAMDSNRTLNISVPISGKSFVKKDSFKVIDITNVSDNVLVVNTSLNPKAVVGNKTTYKIVNDLNRKSLLFTKKFSITGNNYFSLEPSYTIKNNSKRYTVVSKTERNQKNKITSKRFDFFYTSPKTISQNTNTEITFEAKSSTPNVRVSEIRATKKEENKIYSIDQGRKIGSEGGIKRVSVKGVPGTTFKLIVSNSANNAYNFKTGVFEAGGGILEGVVPPAVLGRNYGESTAYIKVPKTTTSDTITVRFIDDAPIDHALITSPAAADIVTAGPSKTAQIAAASKATLTVTIDGEAGGTDFTMPLVTLESGDESAGEFYLGKGNTEALTFKGTEGSSNFEVYDFGFEVITSNASSFILIERQPLFVMPTGNTDNFVAWDSGSDKDTALTSTGVVIPSDWDFEDAGLAGGLDVKIKAKVTGIGNLDSDATGYASVLVKGTISVNNTGTVSSGLSLKLLNFLTLTTPS